MGASGFSLFFNVFPSVVFVEWGSEFIVKPVKLKVLRLGPSVKFKKIIMKTFVLGYELWTHNITKII